MVFLASESNAAAPPGLDDTPTWLAAVASLLQTLLRLEQTEGWEHVFSEHLVGSLFGIAGIGKKAEMPFVDVDFS